MKLHSAFVLALFWALVTVSANPAFAQTGFEVASVPILMQDGVTKLSLPATTTSGVRAEASITRTDGLTTPDATLVVPRANARTPLTVTNPEKSANLWKWSVASLVASNTLDAVSSYGLREGNPLLGTRFNGTSLAIKSGLTAGQIVAQYFVLKRHPEKRRLAAIINFAVAGGLGVVAAHNFGIRSGR